MSPERWERVKELFEAALDREDADQTAFLTKESNGDVELASEVKKLVDEHNRVGSFMSKPLFGSLANPDLLANHQETLGDFRILKFLGSGGMGRVYEAYEISSKRKVAVKVLNVNFSLYKDDISRFEREAWIGGRLNHPNIVKAYGQGEASGLHYIAMELMDGPSVAEDIAEARNLGKSQKTNAELYEIILRFAEVADALHYVHINGIVHRDVKPHNLLLTDSRSKMLLSDFGLARDEQMSRLTRRGDFFGTIRYMSPEQILGNTQVDHRTDIWSLGVTLYEAVTLDLPFTAPTEHAYIGEVSAKEPIPARVRNQSIPKNLETVLMRCLEKDPRQRYRYAADLRDDLRRIATDQPIRVRRPGPFSRIYRYFKQHRRSLGLAAAVSAFLICVFLLSFYFITSANQMPAAEIRPFTTFPGGEYEPRFSPDDKQIAFIWGKEDEPTFNVYVQSVDGSGLRRVTTSAGSESSPAWSPDGQNLAFIRYAEGGGASGVFVTPISGQGERKVAAVTPQAHVFERHLDWSPDGKYFALADNVGSEKASSIFLISVLDASRRQLTYPVAGTRGDVAPAFSPDGKMMAFLRYNGWNTDDLYVVPVAGGQPKRLTSDDVFISDFSWLQDGNIIFCSKRLGLTDLWIQPVKGGKPIATNGIGNDGYFLNASHKTHTIAFSRWAADSNIWQVEPSPGHPDKPRLSEIIASTLDDRSAQFSPDESKIAFRSNRSGTDEIWLADSNGKNQTQVTSFRGPLTGTPRWSPDGEQLAFDSRPTGKGDIYVTTIKSLTPRKITNTIGDSVIPSWSQDSKWIYFASDRSGNWQVWKVPVEGESTQHPAVQVTFHGGFSAFESPDGKFVYYAKGLEVPGIWRVPVLGGDETLVTSDLQPHFWGYWTIGPTGIYFIYKDEKNQSSIRTYSPAEKKSSIVALIPKEPPFSDSGLAATKDGKRFMYPEVDHSESNILLISNFH